MSGTRTSGSRGAPDSASRRRHLSHSTPGPAGTTIASCLRLPPIGTEASIGADAVARAAPLHPHAEEAPDINSEGQEIPARNEPIRLARKPEGAFGAHAQRGAAGEGGRGNDERVLTAEQRAGERERKRMGEERAGIADRGDAAHRARRAQLARKKPAQTLVKTGMPDGEGRNGDLVAGSAHRSADLVIIGELVGERREPANLRQQIAADRDRGAETRPGE